MTALVPLSRRSKAPFLNGMARLIDIGGSLRRYKRFDSGHEADTYSLQKDWEVLWSDWVVVHEDMWTATRHFLEEMEEVSAIRGEAIEQ